MIRSRSFLDFLMLASTLGTGACAHATDALAMEDNNPPKKVPSLYDSCSQFIRKTIEDEIQRNPAELPPTLVLAQEARGPQETIEVLFGSSYDVRDFEHLNRSFLREFPTIKFGFRLQMHSRIRIQSMFELFAQNNTVLTNLDLHYSGTKFIIEKLNLLSNLKILDLSWTKMRGDIHHLASLTRLTTLDLSNTELKDNDIARLEALTNLQTLDLTNNRNTAHCLSSIGKLVSLTDLNLFHTAGHVGGHSEALTSLTNLTILDLSACVGDGFCLEHLSPLTQLRHLTLRGMDITPQRVCALSSLTNLEILNLGLNPIGAEGAAVVGGLTNLIELELMENRIGDAGFAHLSSLVNLEFLDAAGNDISAAGLLVLDHLTNLKRLEIRYNQIRLGDPALEAIQKKGVMINL
ncbi:MAG: leucine-rich repeat domain-containing protein [Holosporales bacterium]